jgi:hypothetical protein
MFGMFVCSFLIFRIGVVFSYRADFDPNGINLITFSEPRMFGTSLSQELDKSFIHKERWLTEDDPLPGLVSAAAAAASCSLDELLFRITWKHTNRVHSQRIKP